MLKKTITYTDYNGTTRKEDFYFNLTQAEVTELEVSVEGGLVEQINRIVAAQNGKVIIETSRTSFCALTVRSLRMAVDSSRTRKSAMPSLRPRRTATCSWSWQPTLRLRASSSTASFLLRRKRQPRPIRVPKLPLFLKTDDNEDRRC